MRILVIDQDRVGLDFCLRCAAHGHEVRWFRYSKKPIKDGMGFKQIQIVDDWRPHMTWAKSGLIITTGNSRFISELDRFRDFGFPIFAPTVKSSELEIKRSVGMEAFKKAGLDLPVYQEFKTLEEAQKFARKSDKSYVFKPMGDEEDKSLTYVSTDPADLVGWIDRQIKAGKKLKGACMLQEKIDLLSELSVSGWFGPDGFLPEKYQTCFEFKRLCAGDIGPNCGEAGSVTKYDKQDKLADEALLPMTKILKERGHRGDFCVSGGVDKHGKFWPFEVTARSGWPAFFLQTSSHKGDPAQWMQDLLHGKDCLKVSYDPCVGVVLGGKGYPQGDLEPKETEGYPISGTEKVMDDLHFCGVMLGKGPTMQDGKVVEAPTFQTSSEYVMVVTGLGKTVKDAQETAYKAVGEVHFADMAYRNDIGDSLKDKIPKLQPFGYAKDFKFSSK